MNKKIKTVTLKATNQEDVWSEEISITIQITGDKNSIQKVKNLLKADGWYYCSQRNSKSKV
jgi:uncharacterized OsmC-like protein